MNAEFQRIARRDKKAFLSDQCKEIEENNRMGKTRDLFKKIRDTRGTFHAKMGSIKDRNGPWKSKGQNTELWPAGPALLLALCRPAGPGAPARMSKGRVRELHPRKFHSVISDSL